MKMRYRAAGLAVGLVMMFSVTVECRLNVVARHPHETWLPSICYGAAVWLWWIVAAQFLLRLRSDGQLLPAQTFRGAINGLAEDTTGAVVTDVSITATNTGTAVVYQTVSFGEAELHHCRELAGH